MVEGIGRYMHHRIAPPRDIRPGHLPPPPDIRPWDLPPSPITDKVVVNTGDLLKLVHSRTTPPPDIRPWDLPPSPITDKVVVITGDLLKLEDYPQVVPTSSGGH